jgi:hypothetical protein
MLVAGLTYIFFENYLNFIILGPLMLLLMFVINKKRLVGMGWFRIFALFILFLDLFWGYYAYKYLLAYLTNNTDTMSEIQTTFYILSGIKGWQFLLLCFSGDNRFNRNARMDVKDYIKDNVSEKSNYSSKPQPVQPQSRNESTYSSTPPRQSNIQDKNNKSTTVGADGKEHNLVKWD